MAKKYPIEIKVKIEAEKLYKAIEKLKKLTPERAGYIVKEAAKFFIQSAQKATPPAIGKTNIPKKNYYRTIFDMKDENEKSARYKVPFRGMYKRGRRFFKFKKSAKEFSYIKYRGMARAGWFVNLLELGENIFNFRVTPEALVLGKKFSLVRWFSKGNNPVCQVENKVPNIERYAQYSKSFGLGKAANRINYLAKREKQKMEAAGNGYLN